MWAPTTDEILNLDGVRRRADTFRFELCDTQLEPIGDLHPDRANLITLTNDVKDRASRRLSAFKLLPDEAEGVNTLSDRLRVYMQLQNGVEFLLGTFLWADSNEPVRSWGQEQHSELVDYSFILDQQSTRPFGWGRGANITLIIFFLLFRAGFRLEDIAHIGHEADRSLAEPVSWQPGTTWRTMLDDLGALVGFATPWFIRSGRVWFDQPPDEALSEPTVPAYEADTRIIADSIVPTSDLHSAPNDFASFDSGTDRLRAGRFQLPASAPHSFAKRGFRIGLTESVQGLETQAQADEATRRLAQTKGVAHKWMSWTSTLDPRHDSWDVVPVLGERWLETTWGMELRSGGRMTHTARRTVYDL